MVTAGYEISGFEKIPESGSALLVYYHGALPIDIYYLLANVILHKHRCLRAVGDRFLFIIPGIVLIPVRHHKEITVRNACLILSLNLIPGELFFL